MCGRDTWLADCWAGLRANWTRTRFEVARRWPKLTDYDLDQIAGDRNELLNRIQDRYGISNERADEQVATWQRTRGG